MAAACRALGLARSSYYRSGRSSLESRRHARKCWSLHGIDANATRRIVHRGALCQPDQAMVGRVIGSPARLAHEAAKRGTVDDGAQLPWVRI